MTRDIMLTYIGGIIGNEGATDAHGAPPSPRSARVRVPAAVDRHPRPPSPHRAREVRGPVLPRPPRADHRPRAGRLVRVRGLVDAPRLARDLRPARRAPLRGRAHTGGLYPGPRPSA